MNIKDANKKLDSDPTEMTTLLLTINPLRTVCIPKHSYHDLRNETNTLTLELDHSFINLYKINSVKTKNDFKNVLTVENL